MIGYSFASKGYKLWDPELKNVMISRNVTFHEGNTSVNVDMQERKEDGFDEVPYLVNTVAQVRLSELSLLWSLLLLPSILKILRTKTRTECILTLHLRVWPPYPSFESPHTVHVLQGCLALKSPTPQMVRIRALNTRSVIAVIFPGCIHLTLLDLPSLPATLAHRNPFSLLIYRFRIRTLHLLTRLIYGPVP